jgi:cyclopropane fatty-acyl-phospholipid synthase-like methyltransferase
MTNWIEHWTNYPKTVGNGEYQKQVQNTVNGEPYSLENYQEMLSGICEGLELEKNDVLLELCCGNGLVTVELAKKCQQIVGIDFSEPLLEVANQVHKPENVSYQKLDILKLDRLVATKARYFNKILLHAGLQFFSPKSLKFIIKNMIDLSSSPRLILLSSIPDKSKKWQFFDTPQRKLKYIYYQISGQDYIGTWWDRELIRKVTHELNLNCDFYPESLDKPASYYRFDVKIF